MLARLSIVSHSPPLAVNDNARVYLVASCETRPPPSGTIRVRPPLIALTGRGELTPSGLALDYNIDGFGRPLKVEDANSSTVFADNMLYYANGAMAGMSYGNGQDITQTLNARLQPLNLHSQMGSTTALDLTYSYDLRGKVTSMLDGTAIANNRTYGYDDLGRLTSASGPWGAGSFTYDALANLRTKTLGTRTVTNTYNGWNRVTSSHDSESNVTRNLSYDSRGNAYMVGGLNFVYDHSDQPIQLSGSANGSYLYDGNLKRVRGIVDGKTIYNVYDASGTLVHIDKVSDGEETDYIGKIARITNGVVTYSHLDHLGSAVAGTDANGAIIWTEQYTPFGEKWIDNPLNQDMASFTGHIDDKATGLTYMQARYYDPALGRFLSVDPVGFTPDMPFMFNSYAYVGNDPINLTDPTGMCPPCVAVGLFLLKEAAGEVFTAKTGLPAPTVKGIGKAVGKKLTKKQVSRRLRRTKEAKDIKSKTGTRNNGQCEFCDEAPAQATDHLETTISEVAEAVVSEVMTFDEANSAANNEGSATDSCTSCNSKKGTKKVNKGFKPKKLSKRLIKKLKDN